MRCTRIVASVPAAGHYLEGSPRIPFASLSAQKGSEEATHRRTPAEQGLGLWEVD